MLMTLRKLVLLAAVFVSPSICIDDAGAQEIVADCSAVCTAELGIQEQEQEQEEQAAGDDTALLQTKLTVQPQLAQAHHKMERTRGLDSLRRLSSALRPYLRKWQLYVDSLAAKVAPSVARWKTHRALAIGKAEQEGQQPHQQQFAGSVVIMQPAAAADGLKPVQEQIVLSTIAIITFGCAIALWFCWGPYMIAMVGMLLYGMSLFLIASWNMGSPYPMMLVWCKFIFTGIIGIAACIYSHENVKELEKDFNIIKSLSPWGRGLYLLLPGLGHVGFEALASLAYFEDLESAGVNGAIICADPIVVALFFYFYMGEKFSLVQGLGMLLTVGGSITIGMSSGSTSDTGLLAVVWALASMTSLAVLAITNRLASSIGLSDKACVMSRCATLGFVGVLLMLSEAWMGNPVIMWKLPIWGGLAAIIDSLAIYAMVRAYSDTKVETACITAIMASSCIVTLLLSIVLLGTEQPLLKYIAMGVVVLGVVLLSDVV